MKTLTKILKAAFIPFAVMLMTGVVWAVIVVPPVGLNPLNQIAVPEPPQLPIYVKSKQAAIRLGKAFFWDMQAGSDGIQACATCHFSAGADNRLKNTLNPGTAGGDTQFGNNSLGVLGFPQFGPNYELDDDLDFPFHQRQEPADHHDSPIIRDTNDVVGSQGIRLSDFTGVIPGSAVDSTPVAEVDPIFSSGGVNHRRVTGRNTPTVINAIFNFSNFWDGRANFLFNGENPFGPADANAGVWFNDPVQGLIKRPVKIEFASLASQATGPPMDTTEMSGRRRTFPMLGRKMLSLVPLGKQIVHPQDSVLGLLSNAQLLPDGTYSGNGLNTTYAQMIQDAFEDYMWDSIEFTPDGYTQMEANFSLYWGLAIQLYEATLVSDETPFDHWLAGDDEAMTDQQKFGFQLFDGIGNCSLCHIDTEFTTHSVAFINFLDNFNNALIELMFVASGIQAIYDDGFTNTAVTLIADDLARGGNAPFINPLTGQNFPLAYSHLAELQAQGLLPFEAPILPLIVPSNMPVNAAGSFKIPGLRNVELTAPYFHNGSVMTLGDVMDFYSRGGNFPLENIEELDPIIGAGLTLIQGDEVKHLALIEFMKALTDPRVKKESAPFDHPEIFIPEGDPEILNRIRATNFKGNKASVSALTINAVISPTGTDAQTVSGIVEAGLTPDVSVDTNAVVGPVVVDGTVWSTEITGLELGDNVVTATVIDAASVQTTVTATITFTDSQPTIISTPPTTVKAGQLYLYEVNSSDPFGDTLTYSLTNAPAGMTIYGVIGLILWIPDETQVGQHDVGVKVTDTIGLFDTQDFTITVTSGSNVADNITVNKLTVSKSGAAALTQGPLWNASGTGTPGANLTISLGPDLTGQTIGTALVSRSGKWKFRARALPAADLTLASAISVSSSAGGSALNVPLTKLLRASVSQRGTLATTAGPKWSMSGTGSPGTTLTLYLGADLTGEVIGTATVSTKGKWKFSARALVTLPIPVTATISVSSSAGGAILNRPLKVR